MCRALAEIRELMYGNPPTALTKYIQSNPYLQLVYISTVVTPRLTHTRSLK